MISIKILSINEKMNRIRTEVEVYEGEILLRKEMVMIHTRQTENLSKEDKDTFVTSSILVEVLNRVGRQKILRPRAETKSLNI